jgi:tRNA threonylcarbamoyl adenosine modification protein (Sua5/YciO/YrdC/YwlC family)
METYDLDEYKLLQHNLVARVKDGQIFIYPTDTIYGIGCDATDEEAVAKLRKVKHRNDKPFSVIAPSKEWIIENCDVGQKDLERLPGPFTLIVKLKKSCVAKEVNLGMQTLGVRIPKHFISKFTAALGNPIVTTSVNMTGEDYMTDEDNLDDKIKPYVDFMIYEGEKMGKPSTLIDLATGKVTKR